MSRSAPRSSNLPSSMARSSFLPPSHKLLQLAAARRAGRPVHATDLRTTKFYKTKMCPFMQSKRGGGRCSEGFDCGYAHAVEELRNAPDLQRTKWCSKIVNGMRCNDPQCGYAHCAQELQPSKDRQTLKTSLCLFWTRDPKFCLNGDKCRFAHGVHDLRKRLALPPRCPSPLINSLETCRETSSSLPTHEGITERIVAPCTDIGDALTALAREKIRFHISCDSGPQLPWETTPYATCPSSLNRAFQSRFLPDVSPSLLQNEESIRQLLLEGNAVERPTPADTSRPNLPLGALRSWRRLSGEYEGDDSDFTDPILTWQRSDVLGDVCASQNATTQIVEHGSFSAATTAGPEGGEVNYPAFPLFPTQVSRCGETQGDNCRHHYRRERATPCALALNLESRGSLQPPGPCGFSLKDCSEVRKELEKDLLCGLTTNSTPESERHYPPVSFTPSSTQMKLQIGKNKTSDVLKKSLPTVPVGFTLPCAPEADVHNVGGDRNSSCVHLQDSDANTQNALFETRLHSSCPQRGEADEQTAPCLPKLASSNSGMNVRRTEGLCPIPQVDMLRPAVLAKGGTAPKVERDSHVWLENTVMDSNVPHVSCVSSGEEQTPQRSQQKARRQRTQPVYSAEKSTKPIQHRGIFPYAAGLQHATLSTVVCSEQHVGSNWENVHSFATGEVEKTIEKKHPTSFSDQSSYWPLYTDKGTTPVDTLFGESATTTGLNKGRGTLNAHAPPFFPRTLLRYTCSKQGGLANTDTQEPSSEPLELSTPNGHGRDTSQASFVSVDGKEKHGTRQGPLAVLGQRGARIWPAESQRQRLKQRGTTTARESQCSSSSLAPIRAHKLGCLNTHAVVQPTAFTLSESRKTECKERQKETRARLGGDDSRHRHELQASRFPGCEKDNLLSSVARVANVRRLPGIRPAAVEMSGPSAFHDVSLSAGHPSATYSEDAHENGLFPRNPESASEHRLTRIPEKRYGGIPVECGDDVYIAASIPNKLRFSSHRRQGHDALVSSPYSIFQEALWLKTRATAERDRARRVQLVTWGRGVNLPEEEIGR